MAVDLLTSLMNLNGGVGVPQGQPLIQGENPLTSIEGLPPGTVPSATPAPNLAANPVNQVTSLEELLFGTGGFNG
jgi:hypothetical protein